MFFVLVAVWGCVASRVLSALFFSRKKGSHETIYKNNRKTYASVQWTKKKPLGHKKFWLYQQHDAPCQVLRKVREWFAAWSGLSLHGTMVHAIFWHESNWKPGRYPLDWKKNTPDFSTASKVTGWNELGSTAAIFKNLVYSVPSRVKGVLLKEAKPCWNCGIERSQRAYSIRRLKKIVFNNFSVRSCYLLFSTSCYLVAKTAADNTERRTSSWPTSSRNSR